MKKILVILAFALIPSFLYAVMSGQVSVGATMNIAQGIGVSVGRVMRFPTQVAGTTPAQVNTEAASAVQGGVGGVDGSLNVTGLPTGIFTLKICQVGYTTSCAGSSGNSGSGGAGHLTNSTTSYDVTYWSTGSDNWTSLTLDLSGTRTLTIKGTISATGNAFTSGTYTGSAICTVSYN